MATNLLDDIREFLSFLGDESLEVADTLDKLGIKGDRGNSRSCPIANLIREEFPTTSTYGLSVGDKIAFLKTGVHIIYLPPAVILFLDDFDNYGSYPNLVSKGV